MTVVDSEYGVAEYGFAEYGGYTLTNTAETMKDDFDTALSEIGNIITITRPTETKDAIGSVTNSSIVSYTIKCIIQPITEKDRDIIGMGLFEKGTMKIFLKYEYTSDDDSSISGYFTPKLDDIITDYYGIDWRIIQIAAIVKYKDTPIFMKAIVKRDEI